MDVANIGLLDKSATTLINYTCIIDSQNRNEKKNNGRNNVDLNEMKLNLSVDIWWKKCILLIP